MNLDIIHAYRRNIANAHPVRALIERREQSEVRTRVKQFRIDRIFANHFNWIALRKIACDRLPCFSQISRTQNQGAIVTRAIGVGRNVGHIRIDIGWLNSHDPLTARRLWQIARQFGPFATVILCNPEPPIIRPRPQKDQRVSATRQAKRRPRNFPRRFQWRLFWSDRCA